MIRAVYRLAERRPDVLLAILILVVCIAVALFIVDLRDGRFR